ncbi:flagellar export chaperone FliS [Cohnella endophytica]|uniref:Flagellar secretion chaperone FliS n=1 Tax=Cohnella endophytica TaxID=2419778 RepID=A0A494X9T3_9BACL|nr:flagellar export chaperone FliS [Cohnella endophytica]RKP47250.1 flagellar export chaperone FliS [Cohnella endophytica]
MLQARPDKYLETAVQTATPSKLLIMLYDGAIRFCRQGIKCLEDKDYSGASRSLFKAQSIINEFRGSLDSQYEISQELHRIYEYFNYRLIQGNIKRDAIQVEEVLNHLIQLKEVWIEAAKSPAKETVSGTHG